MKKLNLTLVFALIGIIAFGQGFRAGLNLGVPVGDEEAQEVYTFAFGLDVNFLWEVSETFDAGIIAGYSHFFGDEFEGLEYEDAGFLPIGGAGRLALSDQFVLGADLGYSIGISPDGNEGGFYYRPMLGYDISEGSQITISYRGTEGVIFGDSISGIHLGINFSLN